MNTRPYKVKFPTRIILKGSSLISANLLCIILKNNKTYFKNTLNTASFLKYAWPVSKIMDKRVKLPNAYMMGKCQRYKMVKDTQKIRRILPTSCLSVFDYFVGLELKVLSWQLLSDRVLVSCHVCVSE